jgi:hypothetical protein
MPELKMLLVAVPFSIKVLLVFKCGRQLSNSVRETITSGQHLALQKFDTKLLGTREKSSFSLLIPPTKQVHLAQYVHYGLNKSLKKLFSLFTCQNSF